MTTTPPDDDAMAELGVRLLVDAFRYRIAPLKATQKLAPLRHDRHLLPRINRQLAALLDGFHRDTQATADIQGFRDEGTDLLVKLQHDDKSKRYVCVQVKADNELVESGLANTLILQWQRSVERFDPLHYFIVLAGDMSLTSRQRAVRAVENAFAKKPKVSVVPPPYLASFLRLRRVELEALVTLVAHRGDPLVEEARLALASATAPQAALILLVAAHVATHPDAMRVSEVSANDWFARLLCSVNPIDEVGYLTTPVAKSLQTVRRPRETSAFSERFAVLLDSLEDDLEVDLDRLTLRICEWQALMSVMLQGAAKFGYGRDELVQYMIDILYPPVPA